MIVELDLKVREQMLQRIPFDTSQIDGGRVVGWR